MFDLRFIVIQDRFDKAKYQVKDVATVQDQTVKILLFFFFRSVQWKTLRNATTVCATD